MNGHASLKRCCLAGAALITASAAGGYAVRAQPVETSAGALASAGRLLEAEGNAASLDRLLDGYRVEMEAMFKAAGIKDEALVARLLDAVVPQLVAGREILSEGIKRAYAAHLSASDMDAETAFALSPPGQRIQAAKPTLEAETRALTQAWMASAMGPVIAQLQNQNASPGLPSDNSAFPPTPKGL